MAGKTVNDSFVLFSNFGVSRKKSTMKTATKPYAKRCAAYKESPRANRHIWFLPTRKAQTKNQKSLNFANAHQKQSINIDKKIKANK